MSFFTQGAHTTLVPSLKTHTEDELDGCADEMDSTLKPVRPGTNGTKGLQLDGRFVSACDGSLPSTPDSAELGSAELDRDTRQLLLDFYRSHTGMCSPEQNHNSALPTMRRVVGEILLKHQIAYKGKTRACALPIRLFKSRDVTVYMLTLYIRGDYLASMQCSCMHLYLFALFLIML